RKAMHVCLVFLIGILICVICAICERYSSVRSLYYKAPLTKRRQRNVSFEEVTDLVILLYHAQAVQHGYIMIGCWRCKFTKLMTALVVDHVRKVPLFYLFLDPRIILSLPSVRRHIASA